jgi:hypothetical protein
MALRTLDMGHTVPPTHLRRSRTTGAVQPPTASVARAGGWAEVFSGDEDAVGVAVAAVDDGSCCNEYSTLVDSYEEGGEARCQQEMELDLGVWDR